MDEKNEPQSKRPQDSDWKQQRLKAWQPLLTPPWVIGTFAAIAIVFIPIGIAIVVTSAQVVEVTQRYDNICGPPSLYPNVSYCNINITIPEKMSSPVYVYYQLTNYFQNHRRYVKSRGDEQLRGDLSASVALCTPIETSVVGGVSKVIVPCGLIANSFFNDTITASYCTGSTCEKLAPSTSNPSEAEVNSYAQWKKTGIAWSTDVADKFIYKDPASVGATNQSVNGFPLPRVDDEDFIVWMRTAGLPTFRKLYRVINSKDLEAGSVMSLTIRNSYPVSSFSGSKSIILSTTSWLGGKNNFLGWCYIAVGALCAVLAIAFQIKQFVSPRRLGDMQYFHWSSAGNKQMDSDG